MIELGEKQERLYSTTHSRKAFVPMTSTSASRNPWLDLCRTLAISLVLLSHGRHFLKGHFPWMETFKFGGFLGVEMFFVLSGFLIGGILLKDPVNQESRFSWIPIFWARRWLRTIPNYLLFVGVNLGLLLLGIRATEWPDLVSYFFFVQNLAWPHPPFFGEAWSLATEEVFYFVVPILMALVMTAGTHRNKAVIWVAVVVFIGSLLARQLYVSIANPTWDEGVRKIVIFRLDALMIGVATAWLYRQETWRKRLCAYAPYLIPLLIFPLSTGFIANSILDQSVFARVWMFPLTSLGCVGLLIVGINCQFGRYSATTVSFTAKLSYSAYLANLPVFMLIHYYSGGSSSLSADISRWLAFIGGTFLVSWFVYQSFERRILLFRDKKFLENKTLARV